MKKTFYILFITSASFLISFKGDCPNRKRDSNKSGKQHTWLVINNGNDHPDCAPHLVTFDEC